MCESSLKLELNFVIVVNVEPFLEYMNLPLNVILKFTVVETFHECVNHPSI